MNKLSYEAFNDFFFRDFGYYYHWLFIKKIKSFKKNSYKIKRLV
jgi:hypothetical protein